MRRFFFFAVIGMSSLTDLSAQTGYYPDINIAVYNNSNSIPNGLAGGLNAPQFSAIDLNNDGTQDLLVYDRAGRVAQTYINQGTANTVDYHFAPEYMSRFPQQTANFMLARDYNCDGIEDLFFYNTPFASTGGIGVWRGSYDNQNKITFTESSPKLFYDFPLFGYQEIYLYNPDLPSIDDMDGDGDIDIVAFTLDFTFIRNVYYYENQSAQLGYDCDSLIFDLRHQCWGLFAESNSNNTVVLSPGTDSCATNPYWVRGGGYRHTGSTLTAFDHDGDGDMDMAMGDVGANNLNMMSVDMINDTALVIQQDAAYPYYDQHTNVFSMPAAYFLDVNNDGKKDMIAAVNEVSFNSSVTDSVAWYYENITTTTASDFDFRQKDFMVGGMLDVGERAAPAFFDYNADGLLDLVVGNYGYCQPNTSYILGLALLENVGTATQPEFNLVTRNYGGLSSLNQYALHPTFGDIDNDGDVDMLLGNSLGSLTFVENTAGAGNTAVWATPVTNYQTIDVGSNSTPQLFDIDDDNDLDLMIGEYNGNINFFENKGTTAAPVFTTPATSETIGWFDVNALGSGSSAPHFFHENAGGDIGMMMGHEVGGIIYLNDIKNNILGTYDTVSLFYEDIYNGTYSKVTTADLDGNDTLEIAVGNVMGGVTIYRWMDPLISSAPVVAPTLSAGAIQVFPNPARQMAYIQLPQANTEPMYIRLYNTLGQLVAQQLRTESSDMHLLSLSELASGIYFVEVRIGTQLRQTIKMEVQH